MSRNLTAELIRARFRYQKIKRLLWPGVWKEEEGFDRIRAAFYERFWQEAARNIGAEVEPLHYGYLRIRKAGKWTFVNHHRVMMDYYLSREMVDNKPLTHRFLQENGCRVPRFLEYDINSLGRAEKFLQELNGPAVVKPASGTGGGQGITTKISNKDRLAKASILAATFDWSLLIEEEVPGNSYRLLYLDGKLVDAVRRDPPTVIGDGRRDISQLIRDETELRLRDTHLWRALMPLTMDSECLLTLQAQGLTPRHVPAPNQQIAVKTVSNQNSRPENHRILKEVHPSLERMGSRMANALGLRLAGFDIITPEIGVPLEESGGVIDEINIPPGLHYHVLVAESDKKLPIGEMVLDSIFSSSEPYKTASLWERAVERSSAHDQS